MIFSKETDPVKREMLIIQKREFLSQCLPE